MIYRFIQNVIIRDLLFKKLNIMFLTFNHVATYIYMYVFLFIASYYSIAWIYHNFLISRLLLLVRQITCIMYVRLIQSPEGPKIKKTVVPRRERNSVFTLKKATLTPVEISSLFHLAQKISDFPVSTIVCANSLKYQSACMHLGMCICTPIISWTGFIPLKNFD